MLSAKAVSVLGDSTHGMLHLSGWNVADANVDSFTQLVSCAYVDIESHNYQLWTTNAYWILSRL